MPLEGLSGAVARKRRKDAALQRSIEAAEEAKPRQTAPKTGCKTCGGAGGPAYTNPQGKLIARPCKKCGKVKT